MIILCKVKFFCLLKCSSSYAHAYWNCLFIVLQHILAKEFSRGSTNQHPNIILHYFITNMQTWILILLANIKPLCWGHQSCQYMDISHYHGMVLVRRDLQDNLVSPCLHISILMNTAVNNHSGQLKIAIPADRRVGPPSNPSEDVFRISFHIRSSKKKRHKQNLIFFFFEGMCVLVYLSSLSLH